VNPRASNADAASRRIILTVEQADDTDHHRAGNLSFGPDGYLWISVGDGAIPATAQSVADSRGSILRIDVDAAEPFAIPADNPFVGDPSAREEIYHIGLRNPWRFSIDEASGLLFIADVGGSLWEELNIVPYDDGGHNFGWPIREGPNCLSDPQCSSAGFTPPAWTFAHADEPVCALIGGVVYRGGGVPALFGRYVFADTCAGLRTAAFDASGAVSDISPWLFQDVVGPGMADLVSLGLGGDGEIYAVAVNTGELYRIEAAQ
jgi:glucose/arabinose dehydrogenase